MSSAGATWKSAGASKLAQGAEQLTLACTSQLCFKLHKAYFASTHSICLLAHAFCALFCHAAALHARVCANVCLFEHICCASIVHLRPLAWVQTCFWFVQSKKKTQKDLGLEDVECTVADVTSAQLSSAMSGCESLIVATSATPTINYWSLPGFLFQRYVLQQKVMPSFTFPQFPEKVSALSLSTLFMTPVSWLAKVPHWRNHYIIAQYATVHYALACQSSSIAA